MEYKQKINANSVVFYMGKKQNIEMRLEESDEKKRMEVDIR